MIACKCVLMLSLTLWYEARGESHEGRMAVASVIYNRAAAPKGKYDLTWVVLRPHQFSCWTGRDTRNLAEPAYGPTEAEVWSDCVKIASQMCSGTFQPTTQADHYYNPSLCQPSWADKLTDVVKVGRHVFGKG